MRVLIEIEIPDRLVDSKSDLDAYVCGWLMGASYKIERDGFDAMPEYTIVKDGDLVCTS